MSFPSRISPFFRIIFIISLTCKTPIRPVETPITPNSSQLAIPFFAGDSGIRSLKLGLFLLRLKTLIWPSNPWTLPKTKGLLSIKQASFIKYRVPKLSVQSQITSNSLIIARILSELILSWNVNTLVLELNLFNLSRAESILKLPT